MNEGDVGEMVGERRALEGDVGEGFPASSVVRWMIVSLCSSSSERAYTNPSTVPSWLSTPILCAAPYPTQRSLICTCIIVVVAYAPSRIPKPPPNVVFFVFIFVRGIHPISEILQ